MALNTLRKGAGRLFGMILMGLLVVSFAIWGIADIFSGYGSQTLIKVGDIEVSPQDYQQVQREVLQGMSQQAGKNVTLQDAKAQGLDAQVLDRLIGGAAVDNHARDLQLGLTDEELLSQVTKDPAFKDNNGKFSAVAFQQALRNIGMTEQNFLETQRGRDLRRQVLTTLGDAVTVPDILVHALDVYNNETRTLRYVLIPETAVPASPVPTETELKAYYDNHQDIFTVPEFRKLGILAVTPQTVKAQVKITDAELKQTYDAEKATFDVPEKRHVYQISFPTLQAAQAASDKIKAGADFNTIAKQQGMSPADTDLGVLPDGGMADPVLGKVAFQLAANQVSAPVTGKLGAIALLKVTDFVPGKTSTFEEAKPKIEQKLLTERAQDAILDLHDKIEDERAAGSTLAEVAKKLKLSYQQIDQVDRQGKNPNGIAVELPQKDQLLPAAFASDTGVENDPLDAKQDGFVWYDVLAVTPQQVRPFDQVKDQVAGLWKEDDREARLAKYTDGLVAQLKGGKSFEDVAKEANVQIQTTQPLKRTGMALNVLPPTVQQAFAIPAKGYGSASAGVQGGRILFQVVSVTPPPPLDGPSRAQLKHQLTLFISDDILSQYFGALEKRYQVTVNHAAVARLTGTEDQP